MQVRAPPAPPRARAAPLALGSSGQGAGAPARGREPTRPGGPAGTPGSEALPVAVAGRAAGRREARTERCAGRSRPLGGGDRQDERLFPTAGGDVAGGQAGRARRPAEGHARPGVRGRRARGATAAAARGERAARDRQAAGALLPQGGGGRWHLPGQAGRLRAVQGGRRERARRRLPRLRLLGGRALDDLPLPGRQQRLRLPAGSLRRARAALAMARALGAPWQQPRLARRLLPRRRPRQPL
mmetsp:Transcript_37858/g.102479  ORF Transcript_37858/g.102479 Transcript_37858/m.102479 type:complete len:242 (-) Transcript_37858:554-1279(-)